MAGRILVPLDANKNAEHILPYVSLLARGLDLPVMLLTVVPEAATLRSLTGVELPAETIEQDMRTVASEYLARVSATLGEQRISTTMTVAAGEPAHAITDAASDAELIMLATHGRIGLERWYLGSVADKVVRTSHCPVLVIRPHGDDVDTLPAINEVIVPLDGSAFAEAALPMATRLASAFGASITLVRSIPAYGLVGNGFGGGVSGELLTVIEQDALTYLERLAAQVRAEGLVVRTHCGRFVDPATDITGVAEAATGALVVMTSRGRSGLTRTLLGSVADRVVRSSAAPVLVVPVPA